MILPRPRNLLFLSALVFTFFSAPAAGAEGRVAASLLDLKQVAVWDDSGTLLALIPVEEGPRGLAWRDGRLFVANRGGENQPGSTVNILDLKVFKSIGETRVCAGCAPRALVFDENGVMWVTGQAHQAVYRIDPPYEVPTSSVVVAWGWPTEIARGPGSRLTVGFRGGSAVGLIAPSPHRSDKLNLGPVPENVASRPSTQEVWTALNPSGQVAVIKNGSEGPEVEWWSGPPLPGDLAFTPDGSRVLLTGGTWKALVLYDAATRKEIGRLVFETAPREVAVAPEGNRAVVFLPETKQLVFVKWDQDGKLVQEKSVLVPGVVGGLLWVSQ